MHDFFQKHNIPYWLVAGTLLGIMRDKFFIEGDNDIDVGVFYQDSQQLYTFFKKSGFNIGCNIVDNTQRITYIQVNKYGVLIDITFCNKYKNGMYQDDYIISPFDEFRLNKRKIKIQKTRRYYFDDYIPSTITKHTFEDIEVNIPQKWQKCLETYYGSNWHIPIKSDTYQFDIAFEESQKPNVRYVEDVDRYLVNENYSKALMSKILFFLTQYFK